MARILAGLMLAIAGGFPVVAGALSLGEIDLKSALNQPFKGDIAVASEAAGDLDSLKVEIASPQTFTQFGLDRPGFLSDFTFDLERRGTGAVLKVSSTQPIIEPFVTLLLEVSWAQGRLLREYTVLLDPPAFATDRISPAVDSPVAGPATATQNNVQRALPPAPPSQSTPRQQPTTSSRTPNLSAAGGSHGPVQRNETLWDIAGAYADTTGVTRNQMMVAIYQANPEAFAGNINRLNAGAILRVPSGGEFDSLGHTAATAEVKRQNQAWRGSSARSASTDSAGRLRLVPPPEADSATAADPSAAGSGRDGAGESAAEAASRVRELEAELDDSRRQLEIRDQELQDLQSRLEAIQSGELPVDAAPIEAPADDAAVDVTADPSLDGQELLPDFGAEDGEISPFVEDGQDVDGTEAADATDAATALDGQAPVVDEPAPTQDVTPIAAADDDGSFIGSLLKSIWLWLGLAIVVLLAWLFSRRGGDDDMATGRWDALDPVEEGAADQEAHEATTRLRTTPAHDDTFLVEESSGDGSDDVATDDVAMTDAADGDWSSLPDDQETPLERTISADSAVNLDQADPIAEADFHMAYGLYDQAAELLQKSVELEPKRKDLRMKLLEVFFIWENQDGFLAEAEALHSTLEDPADPDWNKVLIMGKQLCPENALFAGAAAAAGAGDSIDFELGDDSAGEIDIDLGSGTGEHSIDMEFDEAGADLDFDLSGSDGPVEDDAITLDIDAGENEVTKVADHIDDADGEVSGDAPTMETPTIESPAMGLGESTMETPTIESPAMGLSGESTLETPTIESPAMGSGESTMETPTVESPAVASTMETPTIETPAGDWGLDSDDVVSADSTAEIELDDLGLDLSQLDDVLGDADEDALETSGIDFGSELQTDDTQQRKAPNFAAGGASALDELSVDSDSTAEMRGFDGDTAELPQTGDNTAEQPELSSATSVDLDIGEAMRDEDPTAQVGSGGGVDGATMTEVGTKLDLARAYIDMGDPDGARSILSEVLDEAGSDQRQEAQKLLDELVD